MYITLYIKNLFILVFLSSNLMNNNNASISIVSFKQEALFTEISLHQFFTIVELNGMYSTKTNLQRFNQRRRIYGKPLN
jgi:sulfur transfer protein SufE